MDQKAKGPVGLWSGAGGPIHLYQVETLESVYNLKEFTFSDEQIVRGVDMVDVRAFGPGARIIGKCASEDELRVR
jgi:hypothetical protein